MLRQRADGRRDELLRACAEGDDAILRRHGWRPAFDALSGWWPKAFHSDDLSPYVDLLADEPPEAICAALDEWVRGPRGQFRPAPAEVAHLLHEDGDAPERIGAQGTWTPPSRRPGALRHVRALLANGDHVCECRPRRCDWLTEDLHGYRWRQADFDRLNRKRAEWVARHRSGPRPEFPEHVLRCPQCGGIEQGQADEAQEAA